LRVRLATALGLAVAAAALTSPYLAAAGSTTKQQPEELTLTMAATGNGATVVKGTLQGPANTTFTVDLYNPPSCTEPDPMEAFGSFNVTTNASGHASFTTAVNQEVLPGSGVTAKASAAGIPEFVSECVTVFEDTTPPTVSMGDLPMFQTATSFPVTWAGSDPSGVSFHVLVRQAPFNKGFAAEQAFVTNATTTSETFSGKPGMTYCFRTQATDPLGNSSWSEDGCTAVPVDDKVMKHRKGFKQRKGGDHFMGTFSWARRKGATLILSGVQADQLALLIDRCKRCGKVRVTFPGLNRKVSLKGPKDTQILVSLGDLPARTPGTLRIKSLTDRPVRVDGVGISAI
jgi:hypothetical protein